MFVESNEDIVRRREIYDNVLSKFIKKEGILNLRISKEILQGIPTISFAPEQKLIERFSSSKYVDLKVFPSTEDSKKYPTKVTSGSYEGEVNLRYFEIINIIDKGELL